MVLTKAGLKGGDSSLGLAVRPVLILATPWGTVAAQGNLGEVGRMKEWPTHP